MSFGDPPRYYTDFYAQRVKYDVTKFSIASFGSEKPVATFLVYQFNGSKPIIECASCGVIPNHGEYVILLGHDLVHLLCVWDELAAAKGAIDKSQISTTDSLLAIAAELEARA